MRGACPVPNGGAAAVAQVTADDAVFAHQAGHPFSVDHPSLGPQFAMRPRHVRSASGRGARGVRPPAQPRPRRDRRSPALRLARRSTPSQPRPGPGTAGHRTRRRGRKRSPSGGSSLHLPSAIRRLGSTLASVRRRISSFDLPLAVALRSRASSARSSAFNADSSTTFSASAARTQLRRGLVIGPGLLRDRHERAPTCRGAALASTDVPPGLLSPDRNDPTAKGATSRSKAPSFAGFLCYVSIMRRWKDHHAAPLR